MKNFKGFAAGLIAGVILTSMPIFADTFTKTIEAAVNRVTVAVNGVDMESENILYDGKTYVWIRDVGNMLGMDINWDGSTNRVYIGEMPVSENAVIATVDESEILTSKYNTYRKIYDPAETPETVVDSMITSQVLENKAAQLGFDKEVIKNEKVIPELNASKEQNGEENFQSFLSTYNITEDEYIEIITSQTVTENLQMKLYEEYTPSDEELKAEYDKNADSFETVTAKHILFKTTNDDGTAKTEEEIAKIEKLATDVYYALMQGKKFDDMMQKYGEDPGVEQNPDGYTFTKGQMVAEFENAAFSQEIGKIYKPVKSQYGYHIILVTDKSQISPEEAAESLKPSLFNAYIGELVTKWRDEAVIVKNEDIISQLK